MDESILTSIKKLLGIEEDYTIFDTDIIIHINSVFSILHQLGLGPKGGFVISDDTTNWSDYIGDNNNLFMVKTYVYLKVKLVFDPPTSAGAIEAIEREIKELEWRLNVAVDPEE